MKLLFIHQNFPGQFKHLAPALAAAGHDVHALCHTGKGMSGVTTYRYKIPRGTTPSIHPWAAEFETKVIRGEACAKGMLELRAKGFAPDVVIAHPGWGEALFVKDVWPGTRLLAYLEFFYAMQGADVGFDAEFEHDDFADRARLRIKNANNLLTLPILDRGICPTRWQWQTFPAHYRDRVEVIFDGIDTDAVRPNPAARITLNSNDHANDRVISAGDEVITFVSRNLEPYRGYHIFMRALPDILRRRPNAVVLVVGGDGVSYGAAAPQGSTWAAKFLDEVRNDIDPARVFFPGKLSYATYLRVLQLSACHVYLTYPFVLSWSCLEAMSAGCLVIGSATPPVQEVIEDGRNGLLTDFFDRQALVDRIDACLSDPGSFASLRRQARETIVERYDLRRICLPRQIAMVEAVADDK